MVQLTQRLGHQYGAFVEIAPHFQNGWFLPSVGELAALYDSLSVSGLSWSSIAPGDDNWASRGWTSSLDPSDETGNSVYCCTASPSAGRSPFWSDNAWNYGSGSSNASWSLKLCRQV